MHRCSSKKIKLNVVVSFCHVVARSLNDQKVTLQSYIEFTTCVPQYMVRFFSTQTSDTTFDNSSLTHKPLICHIWF